jgi:hypothetical protein
LGLRTQTCVRIIARIRIFDVTHVGIMTPGR